MKVVLGHPASHKVVFVGPYGVGKTTALRSLSDIPVVSTEEASLERTAATSAGKTTTTVGFDYGEWVMPEGVRVGLFGVPGQERFKTMWDTVLPQSTAVVVWLFGDRLSMLSDCRFWLKALAARKVIARLAVVVTRVSEGTNARAVDALRHQLLQYHPLASLMYADPRDRANVERIVHEVLNTPCLAIGPQDEK